MGLLLRRPGDDHLARLLEACRGRDLTYSPVGCSLEPGDGPPPPGLRRRRWEAELGGEAAFERCRRALEEWEMHRGAGLAVLADGPPAVGVEVAMAAPLPVGFVEVTCRVVAVVDDADRFGFAYGTLPVHPERGEESFVLHRSGAASVRFVVTAVAGPSHPLARLARPVADRLQAAAVDRYVAALRRAAEAP